ncbi:MAG: NAD-dependent dihydropyrimidine dehydrogenase subunit PreA [Oscillospiraceae bacterium]|jgi:dihydropyrimidine dehydrogenase (NAD+) subunit PreA|nr:NAD-dependent dihydropyrimidine dehydrogenase subunit PreA [Oscillospiraceae bacterium]
MQTACGHSSLLQAVAADDAARCLLCYNAPCTAACEKGKDPARLVRALRFENLAGAAASAPHCADCAAPCEKACLSPVRPVPIKQLSAFAEAYAAPKQAVSLAVLFCGIPCENPFFLSSSIVGSNYEMCARALRQGWAGVVFKTIGFLQPKEVSPRFDTIRKEGTPWVGFRNLEQISDHTLAENLQYLHDLKRDFPQKVIVASIMGRNEEEWTRLAELATQAGVDMIECNFSCPHMSGSGLGADVGQKPDVVARYTAAAVKGTHLPVLAKMTPNVGNMEPPAIAAVKAGATGLAAINTIKSITGIHLRTFSANPEVAGQSAVSGYSGKAVKPIALRFIHDMAKCPQLKEVPISGMGGIETWRDAAEFLLLGCSNLQVTTAVMQYGYRIIDDLTDGLSHFLAQGGYTSVSQIIGKALPHMVPADQLDRETISLPVFHKESCIGCGRCYIACADAGHQAVSWQTDKRRPQLIGKKCAGCHLCLQVCPAGAVSAGRRVKKPE